MADFNRQRGFTLIELIIVVLVVALALWALNHFYLSKREAVPPAGRELAESDSRKVIKVTLVGIIVFGGIFWQAHLGSKSRRGEVPPRVIPAAVAGAILLLGVIVVSAIEVFDARRALSMGTALGNVGKATLLSASLLVKSYLAPLTMAFVLSCAVYFSLTYGEIRTIPLVQGLFDWVFSGAPRWLSWAYTGVVALYALGAAIHDSEIDL